MNRASVFEWHKRFKEDRDDERCGRSKEVNRPVLFGQRVRVRNCLDAHLGKIVCDMVGFVDWGIVLLEMLLARFEECWPLPTESLVELP